MTDAEDTAAKSFGSGEVVKLVLLAWLAMLGFDFFLHGGLLAGLYASDSPFLLSPLEAFRRIPIGYLSFLLAAGFLVWIAIRLEVRGWAPGMKLGAAVGGVIWSSLALGLYSISTASPAILVAWTLGQSVEMAYAGAVVGHVLEHQTFRRPFLLILAATAVLVVLTVLMQSLGLVEA